MRASALACPGGSFLDFVSPPPPPLYLFPAPNLLCAGAGGGVAQLRSLDWFRKWGGLLLSRGHHCFPALWFSFAGSCFLPLGSGFDLPGLIVIFFLRLDMFPSVSTYKVKGTCFLKPKVHGLAVAWPLSVCGGLPASACLDSRPSRGQDV